MYHCKMTSAAEFLLSLYCRDLTCGLSVCRVAFAVLLQVLLQSQQPAELLSFRLVGLIRHENAALPHFVSQEPPTSCYSAEVSS